jgi:predicted N-acyltransferase
MAARDEVTLEALSGVAAVPRDEWNALVGDGSPFLEWEWLATLEDAGALGARTGWTPKPLVARRDGRLVAACPLYVKENSEGEFVFDWSWAEAAARAGIRYYPKLLAGVPFTPVGGARVLVAPGERRAEWVRRFGEALREICLENDLSGVHVNFCLPDEVAPLEEAGFRLRLGIQYHWHNEGFGDFEDYLARFRSKRRNQIRRERREMAEQGITLRVLSGDEITPELARPMYAFYLATVEGRAWGRRYLNRRVFDLAIERFRHRLCFVVAEANGAPIAGTFNVQKGEALYGRYWGARGYVRHLHFNVCYYAAIEHCIRAGLARFEPGAGGDYKQLRGFDASPTRSLHFLADRRLAVAVERFLEAERAEAARAIDWLRENSAWKPADPEPDPSGNP